MKKLILTSAILTSLVLTPMAQAGSHSQSLSDPQVNGFTDDTFSDESKEELGFGAGAILGGIFGGPAGAMITGLAGTFLMKTLNGEEDIVELTKANKVQAKNYEMQLASLKSQMQDAEFQHQQELLAFEQSQAKASALQASNLMMSLQFNTGSSDIPSYYAQQVNALASILNSNQDLTIDLSGYTDLLGSSERNQALSLARAESVKTALVNQGVGAHRINTIGYGENHPVVANAQQESSFYDRRVMIRVQQSDKQMAKN